MKKYLFLLAVIVISKNQNAQTASGTNSFAVGQETKAIGNASTVTGIMTTASGNGSTAMGIGTIASGHSSTSMGSYVSTNGKFGSFIIGDGSSPEALGQQRTYSGFSVLSNDADNQMMMRFTGGYKLFAYGSVPALSIGPNGDINTNNSLNVNQNITIGGSLTTTSNATINGNLSSAVLVVNKNATISGSLGIGSTLDATTPNTRLLVRQAVSGASRHPGTLLAVEGNVNSYISILTPTANESGILFSSPSSPAMGGIIYNNNHPTDPNSIYFRVNNGTKMAIYNNGNAWLLGSLTQASDARMKKDITILRNSLSKIMQLNGYSFYWKEENSDNDPQLGIMAQEVQKLFPELVKEDGKGMLSVNYSGLIPVLIESIKEQQKQIDELKNMVEVLLKK